MNYGYLYSAVIQLLNSCILMGFVLNLNAVDLIYSKQLISLNCINVSLCLNQKYMMELYMFCYISVSDIQNDYKSAEYVSQIEIHIVYRQ